MVNDVAATVTAADATIDDAFFSVVEPLLILLAGVFVARIASLAVRRVAEKIRLDAGIDSVVKKKFSLAKVLSAAVKAGVYALSVSFALVYVGVFVSVIRWSVIIGLSVGVVAALLKAGDVFFDLLVPSESVTVGESVSVGCVDGDVVEKGWLGFVVDCDGREVFVPNRYYRRQA